MSCHDVEHACSNMWGGQGSCRLPVVSGSTKWVYTQLVQFTACGGTPLQITALCVAKHTQAVGCIAVHGQLLAWSACKMVVVTVTSMACCTSGAMTHAYTTVCTITVPAGPLHHTSAGSHLCMISVVFGSSRDAAASHHGATVPCSFTRSLILTTTCPGVCIPAGPLVQPP